MSKSARRMSLAIVCLACAGALAPAAPQPDKPGRALMAEEIDVCEAAMKELDLRVRNTLTPDDPRLGMWEQRYIKALNKSEMKKMDKIAALEKLVAQVKDYEQMAEASFTAGQGMRSSALDARFRRLEAEIALAQTKAE